MASLMAWLLGKMAAPGVRISSFTRRTFSFIEKRVFHTFGIRDVLLKRLRNISIEKPTAIQEKALGPVLEGRNTIINAETGSGKTLCYLLPIINNLLADKQLLSRPPYAVVLMPSIELCHQVANVFQSLTDNAMQPCIVHRESKLLINPRHPIILATPNALFNYRLSSLTNVQVVVTDEADLILNGKGDEVWEILSFFKGVDSLKTKKRQRRLARRQKASRQHNAIQESESPSESTEKTRINVTNVTFDLEGECNQPSMATAAAPNRQFVFVAATLPQHGPKSVFNVLKKWIPDAEFVSTGLAHHTVPTVGISYLSVREADKLPELLRCLNVLVGIIDYPLTREENSLNSDEVDFGSKENVGSDSNISSTVNVNSLDSNKAQKEIKAHRERTREPSHEPVSLTNLRVLVFANSTKAAERAFNFLSDIKETGESDSLPWKHVTKNDVTVTTWPVEQDDDGSDGENASSFLTHTGNKDIWIGRVGMIHKRLPLSERIETLNKFKSGVLKVLICTDLASRGLDIQDVSHVIQLDFAPNAAAVLHRTGRTARAGASGKVINFVTEHDEDLVMALQACEDNPNSKSYQSHFSQNRQFRWRLKKKRQSQLKSEAKEG